MSREPRALSRMEQRSWQRVGKVLVPGNDHLPPYDYTNAVQWVPEILAASGQEDEESIRWVVVLMGLLPLFAIAWMLKLVSVVAYKTGPVGALPRLLMIGIKGVIYTSYYSGVDRAGDGTSQVYSGMHVDLQCKPLVAKKAPDAKELTTATKLKG